jgi:hypothetical protein
MVSFQGARVLRIHEGYSQAPDEVLRAIVRFVSPSTRRPARTEAKRILLGFPLDDDQNDVGPHRRPTSPRPEDQPALERLRQMHAELNLLHFGGQLQTIEIRLSNRMRRRLGEVRLDRRSGAPLEISLSRRHLRRDGWSAARQTLLHEMVHQWQAESALPVDHGAEFRRKAREVGIEARAVRAGR